MAVVVVATLNVTRVNDAETDGTVWEDLAGQAAFASLDIYESLEGENYK